MSLVSKNEYWENEAIKSQQKEDISIQYATVIELTPDNKPIIQFMGDSLPSQKIYVSLKHYVPEIGDRVVLINNIIQGGWKP